MAVDCCEVPDCGNLAEWLAFTGRRTVHLCKRHADEVAVGLWDPRLLLPTAEEREAA
jgi:hypothetical protein